MEYRVIQEQDMQAVLDLCNKHKIGLPHINSLIYVAENDDGIKGMIGVTKLIFIEPLIADNALIGKKLYDKVLTILEKENIPEVYCHCDKNKETLFNKAGFITQENNKLIMKKEF